MSNYTFCIILVNGQTVEHCFVDIASNKTKMCLEVMFYNNESFAGFPFSRSQKRDFFLKPLPL